MMELKKCSNHAYLVAAASQVTMATIVTIVTMATIVTMVTMVTLVTMVTFILEIAQKVVLYSCRYPTFSSKFTLANNDSPCRTQLGTVTEAMRGLV